VQTAFERFPWSHGDFVRPRDGATIRNV